jgi:predicted Fe-S protein YdhL (DUF1289 family)
MVENESGAANPASPCVSVCRLDANGICLGCFRHIDEIGAWSAMGAKEQRQVLESACARRRIAASNT